MKKKICFLCFLIFLFASSQSIADVLYVQSVKAKILSEPRFNSTLLGYVNKADTLQLVESDNGWYKVSNGSILGWVHRLCVGNSPPMQKVKIIKDNEITLDKNARRRASSNTSAAAARGLTSEDRKRLNNKNHPDYYALDKLEEFTEKITNEEVDEFRLSLSDGGTKK